MPKSTPDIETVDEHLALLNSHLEDEAKRARVFDAKQKESETVARNIKWAEEYSALGAKIRKNLKAIHGIHLAEMQSLYLLLFRARSILSGKACDATEGIASLIENIDSVLGTIPESGVVNPASLGFEWFQQAIQAEKDGAVGHAVTKEPFKPAPIPFLDDAAVRMAFLAYNPEDSWDRRIWLDAVAWAERAVQFARSQRPQDYPPIEGVKLSEAASVRAYNAWSASPFNPSSDPDEGLGTWCAAVRWAQAVMVRTYHAMENASPDALIEELVVETLRPLYATRKALKLATTGDTLRDLVAVAKAARAFSG